MFQYRNTLPKHLSRLNSPVYFLYSTAILQFLLWIPASTGMTYGGEARIRCDGVAKDCFVETSIYRVSECAIDDFIRKIVRDESTFL